MVYRDKVLVFLLTKNRCKNKSASFCCWLFLCREADFNHHCVNKSLFSSAKEEFDKGSENTLLLTVLKYYQTL